MQGNRKGGHAQETSRRGWEWDTCGQELDASLWLRIPPRSQHGEEKRGEGWGVEGREGERGWGRDGENCKTNGADSQKNSRAW